MKRQMRIVDTTLRDGEQSPGLVFSPKDKIELALLLDEMGVYEIEAGIYDTGTEGNSYIRQIKDRRKQAMISVWSRLNPKDVEEAARQRPDRIHIGTPVSYVQIYSKLGKNKKWIENQLLECLQVAADYQIPVTVGLEDASRADMAFMSYLVKFLVKKQVDTVRLADTVGILFPKRARELVREIKGSANIQVEVHEHNDFGMAVANSLVMAGAGAEMVDVTLFGIGERAGNCDMYDFVHSAGRKFQLEMTGREVEQAEEKLKTMMLGGKINDTQNNL